MTRTTSTDQPGRPLDSFEQALLTELRDTAESAASAQISRSRRRMGAGAAAAAAAVAGAFGISSLVSAPAFAVDAQDNGDIVVTINEFSDAEGLEAALADLGITAEVQYGGEATNVIEVGEDGVARPGTEDPNLPLLSEDDYEGSAQAGSEDSEALLRGSSEGGADLEAQLERVEEDDPDGLPNAVDDLCGSTELPLSVTRDGSAYVITIDGDSPLVSNPLTITTLTRGDDGGDVVVALHPEPGVVCVVGTGLD